MLNSSQMRFTLRHLSIGYSSSLTARIALWQVCWELQASILATASSSRSTATLLTTPSCNIDVLLGMDSNSLLLKDVPDLCHSPFMKDLSLAQTALSDFMNIKGAVGGFAGAPPSNQVHYTTESWTNWKDVCTDEISM